MFSQILSFFLSSVFIKKKKKIDIVNLGGPGSGKITHCESIGRKELLVLHRLFDFSNFGFSYFELLTAFDVN